MRGSQARREAWRLLSAFQQPAVAQFKPPNSYFSNMARASTAASCLLLALFLYTYISAAFGQAMSPFKGQGVDPVTAGVYTAEDRVPVYVSIIFNKLVHVDGEHEQVFKVR